MKTLDNRGVTEIINRQHLFAKVDKLIDSSPLKHKISSSYEVDLWSAVGTPRFHSNILSECGGLAIHDDNYCL